MQLPRWNLNRADWVQFDHLCEEKLTLDTIQLYDELIVLFTDVLCIIAKSCMPKITAKQKKANTVSHLKYNNNYITDVKEISNTLAKQFVFNSSSDNYSHMFNRYRLKLEEKN